MHAGAVGAGAEVGRSGRVAAGIGIVERIVGKFPVRFGVTPLYCVCVQEEKTDKGQNPCLWLWIQAAKEVRRFAIVDN
jgi:hypothetical protein